MDHLQAGGVEAPLRGETFQDAGTDESHIGAPFQHRLDDGIVTPDFEKIDIFWHPYASLDEFEYLGLVAAHEARTGDRDSPPPQILKPHEIRALRSGDDDATKRAHHTAVLRGNHGRQCTGQAAMHAQQQVVRRVRHDQIDPVRRHGLLELALLQHLQPHPHATEFGGKVISKGLVPLDHHRLRTEREDPQHQLLRRLRRQSYKQEQREQGALRQRDHRDTRLRGRKSGSTSRSRRSSDVRRPAPRISPASSRAAGTMLRAPAGSR